MSANAVKVVLVLADFVGKFSEPWVQSTLAAKIDPDESHRRLGTCEGERAYLVANDLRTAQIVRKNGRMTELQKCREDRLGYRRSRVETQQRVMFGCDLW